MCQDLAASLSPFMAAFPHLSDGKEVWDNDLRQVPDELRLAVTAAGLHTLVVLLRERSLWQKVSPSHRASFAFAASPLALAACNRGMSSLSCIYLTDHTKGHWGSTAEALAFKLDCVQG
jgi:hypothetical protein